MKIRLLLSIVFMWSLFSCQNSRQPSADTVQEQPADSIGKTAAPAEIRFEKTVHNFGRIYEGENVVYSFRFTNPGTNDLVISNVQSSCGCTVSHYSKKPIKPGEESTMDITFNSAGRTGYQHKTVSILSNTEPQMHQLEIQAEVIPRPK